MLSAGRKIILSPGAFQPTRQDHSMIVRGDT
jgi:hypothetical protein